MPTRVELRRQVEDLAELPVPADQLQVLVEHRDALAHVVERGLQDFAVVVDRGVGIVEQLERGLGRDRALAQQQRQHQPRGGARRSPRRGCARHSAAAGSRPRALGSRLMRAAHGVAVERGARALLAEIAGDRRGQFLDRDRGAPQPEARRHRRRSEGTNRSACNRSIDAGARREREAT